MRKVGSVNEVEMSAQGLGKRSGLLRFFENVLDFWRFQRSVSFYTGNRYFMWNCY